MSNKRTTKDTLKVAIIGAGPCGLAACKTLNEFQIDFECIEASDRVGGVWNVEHGGSGYRSLHTNTSTRGMAFSDFKFPDDAPSHPSADQMVDYFNSYASHFNFIKNIRFKTRVKNAVKSPEGLWRLEFENGETALYSNLIVATGKYSKPSMPFDQTPGKFDGRAFHASEYLDARTPFNLLNKSVVVVGLGSSGAEIASDLANSSSLVGTASEVILSARSGRWVIPKNINGQPVDALAPHPADPLPLLFRFLPNKFSAWLVRRTLGKICRRQFNIQQAQLDTKLPTPKIQPWEDRPTLSSDFIPLLQSGRIQIKPGIKEFNGRHLVFSDGSETKADAIIYATGYQLDIPFIGTELMGGDEHTLTLYQRIAHIRHDNLFFLGYCPVLCSMWPVAEQQSRWIASLLSGSFKLPAAAIRKKKAIELESSLPVICSLYVESLRRQARAG